MKINILLLNKKEATKIILEGLNLSDICRNLGYKPSSTITRKIKSVIKRFNISTNHFERCNINRVYPLVKKECPICKEIFTVGKGSPKEKTTCSYGCSNTYFRSNISNPNWKESSYRTTCFHHHPKKCVICDEDKIVEVHHSDGNNQNNTPENLIPLCPTHHKYYHSRYKKEVEPQIKVYIKKFELSKNK